MIIDSHCHIYDDKLQDVEKDILLNLKNNNQVVLCCADNITNSNKCIKLANENNNVFAGVGIHPECVETFDKNSIATLKQLLTNKKVVAVGEIGLDYHYDNEIKNKILFNAEAEDNNLLQNINIEIERNHVKQKKILIQQIKLAQSLKLPCIFHVRDCTGDFLDILKQLSEEYKINNKNNKKDNKNFTIKGVVHSFSGSLEVAQIYLKYGLYIGINGVVTFKNSRNLVEVVKELPLERMLIETDSPYLTPEPYRGKLNRPEYVKFVAEKIAEIKGLNVNEVIDATTKNTIELFNLII